MADSPDPRVTRSREAILAAARELLLQEGPAAVTHQHVAARAGVGRATVYRHWPQPGTLLGDAMAGVRLPFFREPVPPVRTWLRQQLRSLADELDLPDVRAVTAALVQGVVDAGTTDGPEQPAEAIGRRLRAALASAQESGELRLAVDARDAAALVVGPLFYRSMLELGPVSEAMIDRLVDTLGTWTGSAHTPV
ncbi:TetR/AcrR family transcriptional regulator [Amycolatopsis sp. NPDC048633]|uniref:TetR/AcrR family transcriptional regulator n=1 Tax=Amycolatopsis sp. NPDC048633 TaxID=3157095 RepID=UPI0033EF8920